jgi:hypothetical protein
MPESKNPATYDLTVLSAFAVDGQMITAGKVLEDVPKEFAVDFFRRGKVRFATAEDRDPEGKERAIEAAKIHARLEEEEKARAEEEAASAARAKAEVEAAALAAAAEEDAQAKADAEAKAAAQARADAAAAAKPAAKPAGKK